LLLQALERCGKRRPRHGSPAGFGEFRPVELFEQQFRSGGNAADRGPCGLEIGHTSRQEVRMPAIVVVVLGQVSAAAVGDGEIIRRGLTLASLVVEEAITIAQRLPIGRHGFLDSKRVACIADQDQLPVGETLPQDIA